jgi:hypothetical protein
LWVEHGMCLKGWLTYPTPKQNYPYPSTATHQAQSSTSMSAVLHVLQRRQVKMDTSSPHTHATALPKSVCFYGPACKLYFHCEI